MSCTPVISTRPSPCPWREGCTCTRSTVAQCRRSGLDDPTIAGEPRGRAVDGEHREHVAPGVDALEQLVQHRRDVVLGDRRDEPDGAAGVGHVGPAGQQLLPEVVVDGGDGTDLGSGHAAILPRAPGRRETPDGAQDLLARRQRAVLAFRHDSPVGPTTPTAQDLEDRTGYDPAFLGPDVPLPGLTADAPTVLLHYLHYSVLFRPDRRFAALTALSLDGRCLQSIPRNDDWQLDPRLAAELQAGPPVYADNDLDRGHLVHARVLDVGRHRGRGPAGARPTPSTSPNAAPQASMFNQGKELWLGLEDYLQEHAGGFDRKLRRVRRPGARARPTRPTGASRCRCGSGRSSRSSQDGAARRHRLPARPVARWSTT